MPVGREAIEQSEVTEQRPSRRREGFARPDRSLGGLLGQQHAPACPRQRQGRRGAGGPASGDHDVEVAPHRGAGWRTGSGRRSPGSSDTRPDWRSLLRRRAARGCSRPSRAPAGGVTGAAGGAGAGRSPRTTPPSSWGQVRVALDSGADLEQAHAAEDRHHPLHLPGDGGCPSAGRSSPSARRRPPAAARGDWLGSTAT